MIGSLLILSLVRPPDPVSFTASESVWVYSHASDPSGDEFLRIWGVGGKAIPESGETGDDWSYGYLKWDARAFPAAVPKSAILTLYNVNPPGFGDVAGAQKSPLQVRGLTGAFSGKEWEFSKSYNIKPDGPATVFGIGSVNGWGESKEPVQIVVNLLKGPGKFGAYLADAQKTADHSLYLALTSVIDPSTDEGGSGKGGVYKVFSAAAGAKYRPMLTLEY